MGGAYGMSLLTGLCDPGRATLWPVGAVEVVGLDDSGSDDEAPDPWDVEISGPDDDDPVEAVIADASKKGKT